MRAELDDRLFESPADTPALLSIFTLGVRERHRVVLDSSGPEYQSWLGALDAWSRQMCMEVVGWSLKAEAHGAAKHAIRVVRSGTSIWSPPALTLEDALDLLHRPYRLLVENAYADSAFVLCMARPEERRFIEGRIDREWLEVETCGGIGGLARRAKTLQERLRESLRCSAIFDCDALRPGAPSTHAKAAKEACGQALHHHMLQRRAIENYLPLGALQRWCDERRGKEARRRKAKVRAFSRLERSQRDHFHVKSGLKKDDKAGAPPNPLFAGLNEHDRGKLHDGFGSRIAELFERDVWEDELKRDGGWHELRPFIEELIERIR
jgi:hypothetical protein